jgi:hypothetical protein
MMRTHRGWAVGIGILVACAAIALIALWPRAGSPGFTGVAVTVPQCPAALDGCRVFAADESDGALVAHEDWSGSATTLNIQLPSGHFAISAQGCKGDQISGSSVAVTSGFHAAIDLGTAWQLPAFDRRICPGFIATASRRGG